MNFTNHAMSRLKMLALCAVLVTGNAMAGTVMTMENKAGGQIRLTDAVGACEKGQRLAYSTTGDGASTLTGCYVVNSDDEAVFILWSNDGKLSTYPFKVFRFTPYFYRTYGNKDYE